MPFLYLPPDALRYHHHSMFCNLVHGTGLVLSRKILGLEILGRSIITLNNIRPYILYIFVACFSTR